VPGRMPDTVRQEYFMDLSLRLDLLQSSSYERFKLELCRTSGLRHGRGCAGRSAVKHISALLRLRLVTAEVSAQCGPRCSHGMPPTVPTVAMGMPPTVPEPLDRWDASVARKGKRAAESRHSRLRTHTEGGPG
jgi:hypothetical protein